MVATKGSIKKFPVLNALGNKEECVVRVDASRNEFLRVDQYWVRNFTKKNVVAKDINILYDDNEIKTIIDNEIKNSKTSAPDLLDENFNFTDVLIISDGLGFENHKELLKNIRQDICVIALNKTMQFWEAEKFPDFYLVSNPSETVMPDMPQKAFPKLISSRRACHKFVQNYRNIKYFYDPTCDEKYQSPISKKSGMYIDEYRNPICAALNCAYNFGARNFYMAYCSDAYKVERPGTVQIAENAFSYPQQILANKIVNANIFWNKISNMNNNIYYTGIKNSFSFAKYYDQDEFNKMIV